MRALNITFQHGHLYNTDTQERIIVKEGTNYILIFDKQEDIAIAKMKPPEKLLSGDELFHNIRLEKNITHIKKLASTGQHFYFHINTENEHEIAAGKKGKKASSFRITLLEDLYLYACSDWNEDLRTNGKLYDCACMVDESKNSTLPFFETIYAKSVNQAIKLTHVHYFGNAGSPGKNAFLTICLSPGENAKTLEELRGFTDKDSIN
jgi:hypothetical protein